MLRLWERHTPVWRSSSLRDRSRRKSFARQSLIGDHDQYSAQSNLDRQSSDGKRTEQI